MGDEVPFRIDSRVTADPGPPTRLVRGSGRGASSSRVVREPGRWSWVVALVLAGLVAGGLVVLVGDARGPDARDDGSGERSEADIARAAYAEAVLRFGRARSFTYRGSVHATGPSALRPGTWSAADVAVEGAVLLPHSLTREVAVDGHGAAVETVTSGPTAWSRTASRASGLAGAPWRLVGSPDPTSLDRLGLSELAQPNRLGVALVVDAMRSAGNRRSEPPDAAGHRRFRATIPVVPRDMRFGDLLAGADVSLTLDDAGDLARIVVTSAPIDDPQVVVSLDIERLGEAGVITPDVVGDPARRTVFADVLEAASVEALELGKVPAGWALTDARVTPGGTMRLPMGCPELNLDYRDLGAVSDGWLSLWVTSAACGAPMGGGFSWGDPFSAGTFSGRADAMASVTSGSMSNGVTAVRFDSDLSVEDAAVMLASLGPLDVATKPALLAGIPSS